MTKYIVSISIIILLVSFSLITKGYSNTGSAEFKDANDTQLNVADYPGISPSNSMTIEAWLKLDTLPTGGDYYCIAAKYDQSGANQRSYQYLYLDSAGTPQWYLDISSACNNSAVATINYTAPVGQWFHMAMVKTGNDMEVFVDGVSVGTAGGLTTVCDSTSQLNIGGDNQNIACGTARDLEGKMDEFRLWTTNRSIGSIIADMNRELDGTEANLGAYFKFNDDGFLTNSVDDSDRNELVNINNVLFTPDVGFRFVDIINFILDE